MRVIAISFLLLIFHNSFSQTKHRFQEDIKFTQYLINKKQHNDAIFLLNKVDVKTLTTPQVDSLHYYLGKVHYNLQDLTNSSFYFSKVRNPALPFYFEAQFFNAYNNMYLGDTEDAIDILSGLQPDEDISQKLLNYEKAGLYLLDRKLDNFDSLSANFSYEYFQFSKQEKSLIDLAVDLRQHKTKSPFLAGLFSAVIPGSGKIYAGKAGQGFASLIGTSLFGLQAWEGYRKDGPSSFRFIAFTTIFSLFYVGNIWGSVFTVKSVNDEFNEAVDHKILFDLHIPLRTIFH